MFRAEQKQIEAAIRESLKESPPSQPEERAAVSTSPRRPNTVGNSSVKDTSAMVDETPSTSQGQRQPPVKQSRYHSIAFHVQ